MLRKLKYEVDKSVTLPEPFRPRIVKMDYEGVMILEKMSEVMNMCDRSNPIYEQISSYSVALYTLGFFDCPDFMSFQDVSANEAAEILDTEFSEIDFNDIPEDYCIAESKERYLLVVGDPVFPKHFAVLADKEGSRPYFSKLPFFGAGFDSMDELVKEFAGIDGVTRDDFHFYEKNWYGQIPPSCRGKIYIVKD